MAAAVRQASSARLCLLSASCTLRLFASRANGPCTPAVPQRAVQVVRSAWVDGLLALLGVHVRAGEVAVRESRQQVVAGDDQWHVGSHPQLAARVLGGVQDGVASAATSGE